MLRGIDINQGRLFIGRIELDIRSCKELVREAKKYSASGVAVMRGTQTAACRGPRRFVGEQRRQSLKIDLAGLEGGRLELQPYDAHNSWCPFVLVATQTSNAPSARSRPPNTDVQR
jgi:hypothetical protein